MNVKHSKIIFDLDGVITSELMYWYAAALTVYELLTDDIDIDIDYCMKNAEDLYKIVFCDGKTVALVKNLGVNSNWDLALVVLCVAKHLKLQSFEAKQLQKVYDFINDITVKAPELYDYIYGLTDENIRRGEGKVWSEVLLTFQHWYLGTKIYIEKYGEPTGKLGREGLAKWQQPIIEISDLHEKLSSLTASGVTLGIGTGRPKDEANYPLELWNIKKYFTPEHCVTYTDVEQAEIETGLIGQLAKPNPFVFLKATAGSRYTNEQLIRGDYDKRMTEGVLIVGDAMSDLLAAKAGGLEFAAVLTGIDGDKNREKFAQSGADYTIESVKKIT